MKPHACPSSIPFSCEVAAGGETASGPAQHSRPEIHRFINPALAPCYDTTQAVLGNVFSYCWAEEFERSRCRIASYRVVLYRIGPPPSQPPPQATVEKESPASLIRRSIERRESTSTSPHVAQGQDVASHRPRARIP